MKTDAWINPRECCSHEILLGRKEMTKIGRYGGPLESPPRALRLDGLARRPGRKGGCVVGSVNVCPGLRGWRRHSHDDE